MKFSDSQLARLALSETKRSYSPYSHFKVGVALATSKNVYLGTNVENSSYGLTVCAERIAVFTAVAAGERKFTRMALASSSSKFITPCGACLQVLSEFCEDLPIMLVNSSGKTKLTSLRELFPAPFKFKSPKK